MNLIVIHPTLRKLLFSLILAFASISFSYSQTIADENLLPGTPQSAWDALDNAPIEGFPVEFSVNKGETVHFKIDVESATLRAYTVKIYRLGWYQGNGARFITDLGSGLTGKQQPTPNYDTGTGKLDCNNWAVSTQWTVPTTMVSGVYIARLDCPSLNAKSIMLFVVRDDAAANSPILFKMSDATWQAYNNYGGNTFYGAGTPVPGFTHATKVSYQRILHLRTDKSNFFNSEYPMLRWMERNGYNVTYTTDMDMARDASVITPAKHKVILSVGHDEYWSTEQRNKFEVARANGVHMAFFSGNEVYWKTRWEDNYQTLVCYKEGTMGESVCGGKCDPVANVWTGLWRDGCPPTYGANDGCNPEGSLTGQMSWTQTTGSIKVPDTYKKLRFWKNTSVASLGAGQTVTLPYGTLGNEWDPEQFTQTYPQHRIVLSYTVQAGFTHKMALYRYSSGALVFSAGTMQWAWGLDDKHDLNTATPPVQAPSLDMQQATVNLLHDMGVNPTTIHAGLIMPSIAADALAPSTVISTPVHNATVAGAAITISGTSADNGSGTVAGVEVSTDNGVTWNLATGLENWSYVFSPTGYGNVNIKVRAWDDLGNLEVPGAPGSPNSITISLSGPFYHSVFNSSYPVNPPGFFTGSPVELGMKFQSSIAGNITGFRYYKSPSVSGTHIGHLWTGSGTLLASATFTNETTSGWQSVILSTPVAISPNTTYVVSYFTSSGDFVKTDPFFTTAVVNGFLKGLANGEDGGNGLYIYNSTPLFPDNTFGSTNYYADVLFESSDVTAPTVTSVTPTNNSTGVSLSIHPSATLSEPLDPLTVTTSSVILTGPGNTVVPGTVSLTGGNVITFTPNSALAIGTIYTMTLKGGLTEPLVTDISGNPLASDYTWSFTTGGLTQPVVTTHPTSQSTCANSSISLVSAASGIPTPTVQWQISTNGGANWTDIPGATTATYTFTALSSDNGNQYHAVWTNNQGSATSNAAILTVSSTINGTIAAVNANICPGDPLMLQLSTATGLSPYNLQINNGTYGNVTVGVPFRAVDANESLWTPADVPALATSGDANSVVLGVKFRTNKNGIIKGIRFYKGSAANGGTHIGSLWSQSGTLLSSATFTNESASGWQEVLFSTPVDVTANTTYVATYLAPQGRYSVNGSYFAFDYSNGNSLTGLQNTGSEPNGVYMYSATNAFPLNNAGDPNYWVDVVFAPYIVTSTTFNLTTITAANGCSLSGNPISSATITINANVNAGTITGTSPMCIGTTSTFTTNGDPGGTWSSTVPSVASVNPTTGLVTALAQGSASIKYDVNGCNGPASASFALTVGTNANAGTVTGTSPVCIGISTTYTSNGDPGGTWTSSNPVVAVVDANSGVVTAQSAGSSIITYNAGCNASASATITVNPNANTGTVSGTSPLCIGATATYTNSGDAGGNWTSANPSIASVNISSGVVTAVSAGSTTIIYTLPGCNGIASAPVTVNPNPNPGTVSGTSPLCIAVNSTYIVTGADGGGTWSSSVPSVATVNPTNGEVTTVGAGSTNITYTLNTGCNTPLASFAVLTVSPNGNAGTVTGASPLCINATATYASNGTGGGTWSSLNPAIATVNPTSGLVTAVSTGSTTITYTVGCNASASATVDISVNANAGTVSGATQLCINATSTFTSNGDAGGTWSSTVPSVATVNPTSGFVTAVSQGSTNITYTVNSGCNSPVSSFAVLNVAAQVTGTITAVNANICPGSPMLLQLSPATGPGPFTLQINSNIYPGISVGVPFRTYGASETVWTPATVPAELQIADVNSVNLGVKFKTNKDGVIRGIRFYKGSVANGGTHIGSLWSQSGTNLASATFTNETATGWQEVIFSAPVAVTANTVYVASYLAPQGNYSRNGSYFSSDFSNGNSLTALMNTVSEPNGVYFYAATPTFPTNNPGDPNYWVDVVFAPYTTTTTTFNLTSITASNGCSLAGNPISTATITVSATSNAGTVSGLSPLCIGATASYTTNGNVGGTWSSTNTAVATVNPTTGLVTAVSAGSSDITYTINGCTGIVASFQTVTINPNANPGTVSGTSPLCIGATSVYTSNGELGGTWSSTNTSVATVNAAGLVTALAAGTTNITYTVNIGCNSPLSAFKTLTVNGPANAGTVSGPASLCTTSSSTYTSNGDAGGTWSSSNPLVATVNATTGEVTALILGNTDITYTINTGCSVPVSSFKTISVSLIPNAGTVSGTSPLCVGATDTYTSNGTGGGTWTSSNPAVASVDINTGLVTALSAGTTNITYTLTGCLLPVSSSKALTVNNCGGSIVNLKLFLQGYYIGGGQMQPVMLNQAVAGATATQADTITVELHDAVTTSTIVATRKGVLNTDGTIALDFGAVSGSYYVAVKHRNSIQTWSANPVTVGAIPATYDFTTSANMAFGDNMKQVGTVWVLYTGDLNQDEFIDANDFQPFDFDNANSVQFVYVATDMNGDGFVDANDFQVFDENNSNSISSIHP